MDAAGVLEAEAEPAVFSAEIQKEHGEPQGVAYACGHSHPQHPSIQEVDVDIVQGNVGDRHYNASGANEAPFPLQLQYGHHDKEKKQRRCSGRNSPEVLTCQEVDVSAAGPEHCGNPLRRGNPYCSKDGRKDQNDDDGHVEVAVGFGRPPLAQGQGAGVLDSGGKKVAENAKESENRGRNTVGGHGVGAQELAHVHGVNDTAEGIGHLCDDKDGHGAQEQLPGFGRYDAKLPQDLEIVVQTH